MAELNFPQDRTELVPPGTGDLQTGDTYTSNGQTWVYDADAKVWNSGGGAAISDTYDGRYLRVDAAAGDQIRLSGEANFRDTVSLGPNKEIELNVNGSATFGTAGANNVYIYGDGSADFEGLTTHKNGVSVTGGNARISGTGNLGVNVTADTAIGATIQNDNTNSTIRAFQVGSQNTATADEIYGYSVVGSFNSATATTRKAAFHCSVDLSGDINYQVYAGGSAPSFFGGLTEHAGGVNVTGGNLTVDPGRIISISTEPIGISSNLATANTNSIIRGFQCGSQPGVSAEEIYGFQVSGNLNTNATASKRLAAFNSGIQANGDINYNIYALGDAPNFLAGSTYIGGDTTRNTFELWKSTLTEQQLEQLEAGTLVAPANVATPGDGEFARQWWYNQQSAEDQALIDSGELDYPERFAAATFTDTFDLGDNTNINLNSNGLGEFKGGVKLTGGTIPGVYNGFQGNTAGSLLQTVVDGVAVARVIKGSGGSGQFTFGGTSPKGGTMMSVFAESVRNGIVCDLRVRC